MKRVRITVEYLENDGSPAMRWERQGRTGQAGTFELLGRAFEVAQREDAVAYQQALAAFMQGAVMRREDVLDALGQGDAKD